MNNTIEQREHAAFAVMSFVERYLVTQGWGYEDQERCWYRLDV